MSNSIQSLHLQLQIKYGIITIHPNKTKFIILTRVFPVYNSCEMYFLFVLHFIVSIDSDFCSSGFWKLNFGGLNARTSILLTEFYNFSIFFYFALNSLKLEDFQGLSSKIASQLIFSSFFAKICWTCMPCVNISSTCKNWLSYFSSAHLGYKYEKISLFPLVISDCFNK